MIFTNFECFIESRNGLLTAMHLTMSSRGKIITNGPIVWGRGGGGGVCRYKLKINFYSFFNYLFTIYLRERFKPCNAGSDLGAIIGCIGYQ